MKFKVLLAGLLLAVLGVGAAQAQGVHAGLEAGANFSSLIGSDVGPFLSGNASNRLGFVGGGFVSLDLSNSFSIRPEILYEQKGTAVEGTSTTAELDYVEIPVLFKLSLGTPVVNPGILLGPSFSWNTAKSVSNGGSLDGINSSDIGVIGGVEVNFEKLFFVSGRYELGLQNIEKNVNVQNGTMTFLIGCNFL